jgi:hypothetical protein
MLDRYDDPHTSSTKLRRLPVLNRRATVRRREVDAAMRRMAVVVIDEQGDRALLSAASHPPPGGSRSGDQRNRPLMPTRVTTVQQRARLVRCDSRVGSPCELACITKSDRTFPVVFRCIGE